MSGIVGDNTARASGVIASAGGGGKILQMQQFTKTTAATAGNTSWAQFSDFEVEITPIAAGSQIMLVTHFGGTGGGGKAGFKIAEDINGGGYSYVPFYGTGSMGNRRPIWWENFGENQARGAQTAIYLHTPSYTLTDVLTYQVHNENTSGMTFYIGRDLTDDNYDTRWRSAQVFQAWEIGA